MGFWTNKQQDALRALYPHGTKAEVQQALPGRSWDAIRSRAMKLGIRRELPRETWPENPIMAALVKKRLDSGISQADVADAIGIARASLCRFEHGKSLPRLTDLQPWCAAVGMKLTVVDASAEQSV